MNPAREKTEYLLIKGFFGVLRILPAFLLYGFCRGLAALFYLFAVRRRKIAQCNIALAFPKLTPAEQKKIARAAFDHFGQFTAESAMILA
ncbi:MAG: hypothetical protein OEL75_02250, partial [Kiritimatiellaceae bacterium]|nr:hypothetical protein [Kiritimatiellaceae bacterium]